jgi:hypothetical protein
LRDRAAARSRALSTARLLAFLLLIGAGVLREIRPSPWPAAAMALFAMAFVLLIARHQRVRREERWYETLRALNEQGLHRLARVWGALPVRTARADVDAHAYAADVDVFGTPALAQLLGPTSTPAGRATLEAWLLSAASAGTVRARQEAVRALAGAIDVRDAAAGHALASATVPPGDLESFLGWAESPEAVRHLPLLRALGFVVPAATLALIIAQAAGWIAGHYWILSVAVAAAVTFGPGRAIDRTLRRAFRREGMFTGYPELLATVAHAPVDAPLIGGLRARITTDGVAADRMMDRLGRLMHLADLRHSGSLYLPVQLLTLWDVHVMVAVERWRRGAGPHVRDWLDALGEFEALAALGTLAHDQPEWAFPEIATDGPVRIDAQALGHPMLPDATCVTNDVALGPPGTVLLITGSNMSGKSTLLRSLGTNTVLALAGAPVCARHMRLPVLSLHTSIRVADSVVQGVSYFMAQLQRMKQIVSAADAAGPRDTPVLYLLDEILQGTNTAERRIAATRVIRHLVDGGAIGAVTTHDLELADEPALRDALVPVHFTETVNEDGGQLRMSFDYRLRPGIATSTNALALMRMVGLADQP